MTFRTSKEKIIAALRIIKKLNTLESRYPAEKVGCFSMMLNFEGAKTIITSYSPVLAKDPDYIHKLFNAIYFLIVKIEFDAEDEQQLSSLSPFDKVYLVWDVIEALMNKSFIEDLRYIPAFYFAYDNMIKYHVPDGVTKICSAAFYSCTSLQNLTIPESVSSLGADVPSLTAGHNKDFLGKILINSPVLEEVALPSKWGSSALQNICYDKPNKDIIIYY